MHACLGQDCWEPGKALVDTSPQCAASPQTPPQTASSSLSPLSHGFRTHTQHSRPSPAHRFPGSPCPPQAPGLCASPKPTQCPPHPLACSSRPWQRPRPSSHLSLHSVPLCCCCQPWPRPPLPPHEPSSGPLWIHRHPAGLPATLPSCSNSLAVGPAVTGCSAWDIQGYRGPGESPLWSRPTAQPWVGTEAERVRAGRTHLLAHQHQVHLLLFRQLG